MNSGSSRNSAKIQPAEADQQPRRDVALPRRAALADDGGGT